jgi:hypothetical protein
MSSSNGFGSPQWSEWSGTVGGETGLWRSGQALSGSMKAVSRSVERSPRLHGEPPKHGMARLRSSGGLRVLWKGQRFVGARTRGGWKLIHGPPARLVLKPANQGTRRIHTRIRLGTHRWRELLELVGRRRLGTSDR